MAAGDGGAHVAQGRRDGLIFRQEGHERARYTITGLPLQGKGAKRSEK